MNYGKINITRISSHANGAHTTFEMYNVIISLLLHSSI